MRPSSSAKRLHATPEAKRAPWLPLFTLLVLLLAAPAQASVFDVFGMTARATAMGGAQGAAAVDHASVFYNPAALTSRKKTHLGVTTQLVAPRLAVEQTQGSSRDAILPPTNLGFTFGVVFPLGGKIEDRVALGFAIFLPLLQATRYEAIDPATPQFYLYQSLPDAMVISGAVAVEVFEWLSIGVGAQVLANFEGEFNIDIAVGDRRVTGRNMKGELFGELAAVVGVLFTPIEHGKLGFTYRGDYSLDFDLPVDFTIEELGLLAIQGDGRGLYTPEQLNFGLSYLFDSVSLLVAFDLTWMRWSKAPSPALHIAATLDDAGLQPGAPEPFLDFETVEFDLGAQDIVVPRLGVEYRHNDFLAVQGGYHYRASPIPEQVGYTNYIDAAAHVLSVGSSLTWKDPLEIHENPVSFDFFLQLSILEQRNASKIPSRDHEAVGNWKAAGTIWNFGMEWRHDF